MSQNSAPGQKADILIIDDTPDNLRLLNQMLSNDYKVRLAPSGEIGLTAARSMPPDLILLDVMMPGLNGYEVATQLKADSQTAEIPIIFISALADTESKVHGFAAGGVDYVAKPFQEKEVLARVKTHLALCALNRQLRAELAARQQAEVALRESENKYRMVADFTLDWEFWLDPDGNYVYISPACERITGYTADEFQAAPQLIDELVHPDDRAAVAEHLALDASADGPGAIEFRIITRNGAERWIDHVCQPVHDQTGQWLGRRGSNRDITERKRTEAALKRSEAFARSIIENEPECVKIIADGGILKYMNQAGLAMIEVDDLAMVAGQSVYPIVAPEHRAAFIELTERVLRGEQGSLQFEMIGLKGTRRWLDTHAVPLLDDHGKVEALLGLTRDITERKQHESQTARHVENMATLSQTSQQMLTTLELDQICTVAHSAVQKLMPCDSFVIAILDEAKQEIEDVYLWDEDKRWPNQRYSVGQGLTDFIISSGKTLRANDWDESHTRMTKTSLFGNTDRDTRSVLAVPLLDGKSRCFGMISAQSYLPGVYTIECEQLLITLASQIARAIENASLFEKLQQELETRKRAEESLRKSEERYRLITQNAEDIIWTTDMQLRLIYGSPSMERALGYTAAELMALSPGQLMTPESLASGLKAFAEEVEKAQRQTDPEYARVLEMEYCRKDGSTLWVEMKFSFFRDRDGQLTGVLGVGRDVTERKRAEVALRELNATLEQRVADRTRELIEANLRLAELSNLRTEFITRISHELRTPLANIKLYHQLLEHGIPEKRELYFHTLHEQTDRLQRLIEDLLDVSHLSLDDVRLQAVVFDVNMLVHEMVSDGTVLALRRGLTLMAVPAPKRLVLNTDRDLLRQALGNVLINALNYTPHAGTVTVQTDRVVAPEGEWVTIEIRDTGPGITAQELPRIFEPFYRGRAAADYKIPGTGVGLSITQRLIGQLGGRITVASQPGQGTAFTIWLHAASQ